MIEVSDAGRNCKVCMANMAKVVGFPNTTVLHARTHTHTHTDTDTDTDTGADTDLHGHVHRPDIYTRTRAHKHTPTPWHPPTQAMYTRMR